MPPRWNWDPSPLPLPRASLPLSPELKGGGGRTRLRARESPKSNDWRKSLALCLLCGPNRLWVQTVHGVFESRIKQLANIKFSLRQTCLNGRTCLFEADWDRQQSRQLADISAALSKMLAKCAVLASSASPFDTDDGRDFSKSK